jgi:site-specific DNA recombinase
MALRALIEIRLSNETEESTSPERQREQDEAYCGSKGRDIVHVCEDLDASGAIPPFDRGDLGRWLREQTAENRRVAAKAPAHDGRST